MKLDIHYLDMTLNPFMLNVIRYNQVDSFNQRILTPSKTKNIQEAEVPAMSASKTS